MILTGAGKVLGDVAAVTFIWAIASAGATWIMGADRSEAIAAADDGRPRLLGACASNGRSGRRGPRQHP